MQQQHDHQFKQLSRQPRWFHSSTLRYFILLNDVRDGDRSRAESQFATMQATYGSTNCFLLHINSLPLRDGLQSQTANKKLEPILDLWTRIIRLEFGARDAAGSGKPSSRSSPLQSLGDSMDKSSLSSSKSMMFGSQTVYNSVPSADPLSQTDDFPEIRHAVSYGTLPGASQGKDSGTGSMQTNGSLSLQVSLAQPTRRGQCLSVGDADRVREMVEHLTEKCFVPFLERLFRTLAEQVNSVGGVGATRRGGKSIFGNMKRIFGGTTSSGSGSGGSRTAVEAVPGGVYLSDSPELLQRRYADLALLLQQYELAYQVNHKLKSEFLSEHAWEQYASAMELAGVASFLQEHRVYPPTLMEQAISRYLHDCKCACTLLTAVCSCTLLLLYCSHAALSLCRCLYRSVDFDFDCTCGCARNSRLSRVYHTVQCAQYSNNTTRKYSSDAPHRTAWRPRLRVRIAVS